jgi:hypothetical protein
VVYFYLSAIHAEAPFGWGFWSLTMAVNCVVLYATWMPLFITFLYTYTSLYFYLLPLISIRYSSLLFTLLRERKRRVKTGVEIEIVGLVR